MSSSLEGIVLYKTLFKEKDLIVHLLARDGQKYSICFYGAGVRANKSSFSSIELGHMLKVNLRTSSKKNTDLIVASEWNTLWLHSHITSDYSAYCYMCFLLEITSKISQQHQYCEGEEDHQNDGIFNVLSNALFQLNQENSGTLIRQHMAMFLGKLLYYQGLFPRTDLCIFCNKPLLQDNVGSFKIDDGGFGCLACNDEKIGKQDVVTRAVWKMLLFSARKKYEEFQQMQVDDSRAVNLLLDYFYHHNQIAQSTLKSLSFMESL